MNGESNLSLFGYSSYPPNRCQPDSEGIDVGKMGSIALHQNVTLSTQPICGFDWSPDKLGLAVSVAFDQTIRVLIVTKLNML